jgi:hypothetical protein
MSGMRGYTVSRILVALGLGLLFVLAGAAWWQAALIAAAAIGWFLWAPHSGRYQVDPQMGIAPLRRDERGSRLNDAAGRNAFVAVMLAAGAAALYAVWTRVPQVSVQVLNGLLILGVLVYFGSDYWLRRRA